MRTPRKEITGGSQQDQILAPLASIGEAMECLRRLVQGLRRAPAAQLIRIQAVVDRVLIPTNVV